MTNDLPGNAENYSDRVGAGGGGAYGQVSLAVECTFGAGDIELVVELIF